MAPPVFAGSFYVAPSGSDSAAGSEAAPWGTLGNALLNTGPGDTVYLRQGTYAEAVEMRGDPGNRFGHTMGGSATATWTLSAYPGETATLTASFSAYSIQYSRLQNLTFEGGAQLSVGTADWVTPSGDRSHHVEISGNTFSGAQVQYGFIEAMFDNSLIEGNTVTVGAGGGNLDHGIYLHNGDGNVVRGNVVSGAAAYCLHVYDERKHPTDPQTFFRNVVIENNALSGARSHAGLIISQGGDTRVEGVLVRNNVLVGNAQAGIDLTNYGSETMSGIKIYGNTIDGSSDGILIGNNNVTASEIKNNLIRVSGAHLNQENAGATGLAVADNLYSPSPAALVNITDSNPVVGDPAFAGAGDYHLTAGSAAIDQGLTLSDVPADKDGKARPIGAAYDLGAYEFGAGMLFDGGTPDAGGVSADGGTAADAGATIDGGATVDGGTPGDGGASADGGASGELSDAGSGPPTAAGSCGCASAALPAGFSLGVSYLLIRVARRRRRAQSV